MSRRHPARPVRTLRAATSLAFASVVGVASALLGCALPTTDAAARTTNNCSTNAECGDHGLCAAADGGSFCVATEADLGSVILEVRPASDVTGDTVSQVFTDKLVLSGSYPDGALPKVALQIPDNLTFSGEALLAKASSMCSAEDGSLPVKVELHSISAYSNLSSIYRADAVLTTNDMQQAAYRYSLQVPAGTYDVYLTPSPITPASSGVTCANASLQPLLLSGVQVSGNTEFKPDWPDPLLLNGSIVFPPNTDVTGWTVEVVDPDYGLVLSDNGTLGPQDSATGQSQLIDALDVMGLRYSYKKSAIIRLTAPDGKLVVHWSLDAVDPMNVKLSLADLLATTNTVEATVVDESTPPNPVPASVRIRSVSLTGNANQNASFRVDTDTDANGKIHVDLVEGTYQVSISPKASDGTSATLVDTWEIKDKTLGFGHSFVLPERPTLRGSVTAPGGAALDQVAVLANPVANSQSYLATAFDSTDSQPRNASGQTDAFGDFSLLVDPGTVDFSVQPTADTGFPWLLVPSLLVSTDANLKTLAVPAPALVSGSVSSTKGVVPSAVVRAWIAVPDPTDKSGTGATTLLQIGETVSDNAGSFTLPLPPSISFTAPK